MEFNELVFAWERETSSVVWFVPDSLRAETYRDQQCLESGFTGASVCHWP